MANRRSRRRDPLEIAIELALQPGRFISYGAAWGFVSNLERVASQLDGLLRTDPGRAVRLYDAFLAGCYEKAEGLDDSSGNFGMLVADLYRDWLRARQAASADAEETVRLLLDRLENDPYGFAHSLEDDVVNVMSPDVLAAFARQVRPRFDSVAAVAPAQDPAGRRDPAPARRRWGQVLRAIHARRRDVPAYIAVCEHTELSAQDCLAIATMLRARRQRHEALAWVDRGLTLDRARGHGSLAGHHLAKLKRELLVRLGRSRDALEDAWTAFREHPSTYSYEELMRFVPRAQRAAWRAKAMDATARADLGSLIELWLETSEIGRLAERLRAATDAELEGLSHHWTEPAARRLAKAHPAVAAKVYRAIGMRILLARKSKYYDAALSSFEDAKRCYERSGLHHEWTDLVATVRRGHHRKAGFMAGFERLAAGQRPSDAPSFLDRAQRRWSTWAQP